MDQGIDNILYLLFIFFGNLDSFLQNFNQIIFFKGRAFLYLPLFLHLLFDFFIALASRFLTCLGQRACARSTGGAALLWSWEIWGTRHRHLVSIETQAVFVQCIKLTRHIPFVMLDNFQSEIPLIKFVVNFQHLIFLYIICQIDTAFRNIQQLLVFVFVFFFIAFSNRSHESIWFWIVFHSCLDVVTFDRA